MRRSAAPSLQPAAKRLHFLPPLKNYELQIDKENELFSLWNSNSENAVNSTPSEVSTSEEKGLLTNCKQKSNNDMHTKEEFLKLLLKPVSQEPDCKDLEKESDFEVQITNNIDSSNDNLSHPHMRTPKQTLNKICNKHEESTSFESVPDSSSFGKELYYNVLWCKRSSKKHKVWEGDGGKVLSSDHQMETDFGYILDLKCVSWAGKYGILTIKNRSALLKDSNGKVIDRGIGYKLKEIESLEDGSKFYIGGKECEIQYLMSSEECKNFVLSEVPGRNITVKHDNNQNRTNLYPARKLVRPSLKFISPQHKSENLNSSIFEDDLILPSPTEEHQEMYNKKGLPVMPVRVERFLARQLRVHQKEGIIFLYKCILGFQHEFGQGAILADEMGLGKTLQCIALIWTLYKQGPYGGKPILKTIIVITPSSLVTNWKKEFHKWLGELRLTVYAVDKKHTVKDFIKTPKTVLIISYEMFSRSSNLLSPISFDLVICDEGHRIKNLNIKISNVVNCLKTNRRILLTGTPIQNDLAEFFSIVDFVNPGALGSIQSFRRSFEKPIMQSRDPNCSEEEREIGEQCSEELNMMASAFMLRRTQEVINQFLPSKTEVVAFCRPTELQKKLYMHLLNTGALWKLFSLGSSVDSSLQLVYISVFRKLCNHPSLLYSDKDFDDHHILNCIQSVFPTNYQPSPSDSGKMKVLEKMLAAFFTSSKKEKIVIVSCFTQTLNIIEELCRNKSYLYLRLDGSTTSSSRQDLVDVFNRSYTKYNIFLLSSKAGGVGFNLIGASRILLYDNDWNPANDLQAMARIWRDGQKHSVYIYRLLTTGTIEEKIYQRQISKQCLSGSVLNPGTKEKLKFSHEELKDLFTFHDDSECLTHDLINCDCLNSDFLEDCVKRKENDSASQKVGMEELLNWHHACGPINNSITSDSILASGGNDITFMFSNTINSAVNSH